MNHFKDNYTILRGEWDTSQASSEQSGELYKFNHLNRTKGSIGRNIVEIKTVKMTTKVRK